MSGIVGVDRGQQTLFALTLIRAAALRLEMKVDRFSMRDVHYCLDTSILRFDRGHWRVVLGFQIIFYPLSVFFEIEWVCALIAICHVELALVHV